MKVLVARSGVNHLQSGAFYPLWCCRMASWELVDILTPTPHRVIRDGAFCCVL